MNFTYNDYKKCQEENVPDCASNHDECIESLEEISSREDTNDSDCL
jgi:hypothetical protein